MGSGLGLELLGAAQGRWLGAREISQPMHKVESDVGLPALGVGVGVGVGAGVGVGVGVGLGLGLGSVPPAFSTESVCNTSLNFAKSGAGGASPCTRVKGWGLGFKGEGVRGWGLGCGFKGEGLRVTGYGLGPRVGCVWGWGPGWGEG